MDRLTRRLLKIQEKDRKSRAAHRAAITRKYKKEHESLMVSAGICPYCNQRLPEGFHG